MAGITRLGSLILGINRQQFPRISDSNIIKGKDYNNLTRQINERNVKVFEIFREILTLFVSSGGSTTLTLQGINQPNPSPPGAGVLYFDSTLGRFRASENSRPYFDAFPREGCRTYNSVAQAVPNGVPTALTFDTNRYDPFSMHSVTRITIPRSGNYVVGGCIEFAAAAGGYRRISVRANGVTEVVAQSTLSLGAGADTVINTECIYQFTSGDYLELVAFQNSGGPINANAAPNYSAEFWCGRIHDQP